MEGVRLHTLKRELQHESFLCSIACNPQYFDPTTKTPDQEWLEGSNLLSGPQFESLKRKGFISFLIFYDFNKLVQWFPKPGFSYKVS